MENWRKLLLGLLLTVMVAIIILTWGSIGSAMMVLAILAAGSVLLWRRFVMQDDEESYFD